MAKGSPLRMSLADAMAHQERHGFKTPVSPASASGDESATTSSGGSAAQKEPTKPRKPRMNLTETEYARILEAQKQRYAIAEYRFEGISLSWGADPKTGKPMWYTPDFYVVAATMTDDIGDPRIPRPIGVHVAVKLIEVKGGHIFAKDLIRFKGCRAEWPQFSFELWQKKAGEWTRLQ